MSTDLKTKVIADDQTSFDEDPKAAGAVEAARTAVVIPDRAQKEKKLLRKLDARFSIMIVCASHPSPRLDTSADTSSVARLLTPLLWLVRSGFIFSTMLTVTFVPFTLLETRAASRAAKSLPALTSFLDFPLAQNLSASKTKGLVEDLNLTDVQYQTCLSSESAACPPRASICGLWMLTLPPPPPSCARLFKFSTSATCSLSSALVVAGRARPDQLLCIPAPAV